MGAEEIIGKLTDERDRRSILEVPPALDKLDASSYGSLTEQARTAGVVNQLGVIVDLTLKYLICESHPRYRQLEELSEKLYSMRLQGEMPFYKNEPPELVRVKKDRLSKLTEEAEFSILKKWGVISVLSPSKFKQVYGQEHDDRQTAPTGYSSYNQ